MIEGQSRFGDYWQSPAIRAYVILMAAFWILGFGLWASMGYEGSFLWLNKQRFWLGDLAAPHLTHLGDGVIVLGLFGATLIPNKGTWILSMLATFLCILVVILLCKNVIFEDWDRPLIVFSGKSDFFYNALSNLRYHAFPSGHSAAIAGAMGVWILALRPKSFWLGLLMAIGTIFIAMTRLYIGVHFLGDVIVGTLVGSSCALLVGLPLGDGLEKYIARTSARRSQILQFSGAMLSVLSLFVGFILVIARYYS